jgi:chromosome segregation ATPase
MAMARRRATKARSKSASADKRRIGAKGARPPTVGSTANGGMQARLAALERERDELKAELERFKARQQRLEETQAQVRDRLAWALDSLHNILEGKG